jgi:LmbE family N-acetylglucosaminyl deacetylase
MEKNVLVAFAHPDDETGCSGTIAKLAKEGHNVYFLCQTNGSKGTYDLSIDSERLIKIRDKELREAAEVLGVRDVTILGNDDGDLQPTLSLRGDVVHAIRKWKTSIVFTLDPWLAYEAHPDHRHAGMMAAEAAVFSGFHNFYPEHKEEGLAPQKVEQVYLFSTAEPNTYVDITEFIDQKINARLCHRSQITQGTEAVDEKALQRLEDRIKGRAEVAAKKCGMKGIKYAEAFKYFRAGSGHLSGVVRF